jgi:hypothetical protein
MTLWRTVFRLSDTEFEWHWLLMNFSHGKTFGHLAVRFWWVFWIRSEVIFSELYSLRA